MAARVRLGRRSEPRLDPVRWRRPGAGLLIRLAVVAVLLSVAAVIAWSEPPESATRSASLCNAAPGRISSSPEPASPHANGRDPAAAATDGHDPAAAATDGHDPVPAATDGRDPASAASDGRDPAAPNDGQVRASAAADGRDPASAVPPGSVGVPVRLAEPTALALVRPGDRVDLLRIEEAGHGTTPVAAAALVLGVTGTDDPTTGGLLVALRPADAEKAVAAQGQGFAILIRPS